MLLIVLSDHTPLAVHALVGVPYPYNQTDAVARLSQFPSKSICLFNDRTHLAVIALSFLAPCTKYAMRNPTDTATLALCCAQAHERQHACLPFYFHHLLTSHDWLVVT